MAHSKATLKSNGSRESICFQNITHCKCITQMLAHPEYTTGLI